MEAETDFFLFLVERYAAHKKCLAGDVIREWDRCGITQEIFDNYEMYHQERIENAFEDIDCLIQNGKHAW